MCIDVYFRTPTDANFEKTSKFQFSMLDFMTFGITPSQNIEENSSYRNN